MTAAVERLDPSRRSPEAEELESALRSRIVGQEEGVQAVVDLYQVFRAGLHPSGRPVGNLLFLGPTGSGKTRLVEAVAEALFGDSRAVLKIDCAEFQHSHEIAKLIGSPPGYLGHRETHPLITQEALAQWYRPDLKLSLVLFDEIEKASDALWQLLLGILDKATLTLGDNRRVDLSSCLIFMTSNLGGTGITELVHGGLGFVGPEHRPAEQLDSKIEQTAREAARRKFSPEFFNRIDRVVVFHPLRPVQLEQVLEIELGRLQERILSSGNRQFVLQVTPAARRFLLEQGTDVRYGARHLKRVLERHIVFPLANLLASRQIETGDVLRVDWQPGMGRPGELIFLKEAGGSLVHVPTRAAAAPAPVVPEETTGQGLPLEMPTTAAVSQGSPTGRASGNE